MLDSIFFSENGYVVSENILHKKELEDIREIYELFIENKIEVGNARSDLSGLTNGNGKSEKITLIMRPSYFFPDLAQFAVYTKALNLAKSLLGNDMSLYFVMLIYKSSHTNTPTPCHQDESYWIDMEDTRATS